MAKIRTCNSDRADKVVVNRINITKHKYSEIALAKMP